MNTYRVPHRAADAGSVTVDKSVAPHGVHDQEAVTKREGNTEHGHESGTPPRDLGEGNRSLS